MEKQSAEKRDADKIMIERLIEGLYESNDKEEKGEYVAYYDFIFHQYDPISTFVSTLPTIMEDSCFTESIINEQKINRDLYRKYINFYSLINNWVLNGFINCEEKDKIIVHYNFLSLFVHPNREQLKILRFEESFYTSKNIFKYKKNEILSLLISLYALKLEELCLTILSSKLEELSKSETYYDINKKIRENSAPADILWFIYDKPTEFDKKMSDIGKKTIERNNNTEITYYTNPYDRLKIYVNETYKNKL